MPINWKYDVLENPVIRIVCFLLGLASFSMGVLSLVSKLSQSQIVFNSNLKFAVAATVWGLIFFYAAAKKSLKRRKGKGL